MASTMKFVVPFMMPEKDVTSSMRRTFSIEAIQGMPPPTDASMSRLASVAFACRTNSSK